MTSKRDFKRALTEMRELIFENAFDPSLDDAYGTVDELARAAGLSWQTVHRLYHGETKSPRFETVYRLAEAVGFRLDLVQKEIAHYA